MLVMLDNMDIHDCLIYLEENGVTNAQIIEKMGCNRTTVNDWWKTNKASPRYLAKMRKFCTEYVPIPDLILCDKPPKYMFEDALKNQMQYLHDNPDEDEKYGEAGYFSGRYFSDESNQKMAYDLGCLKSLNYLMGYPDFYDSGIPPKPTRRYVKYKTWYHQTAPNAKFKQLLCSIAHPDKRVRDYFTSVLQKET